MRLGDLDELKATLFNDTQYGFWHDSMDGSDVAYTQRDLFKCIDAMPTIDAVEVVRCKDCKHYWKNKNTPGYLDKCVTVSDNDYCSDGERKDGE